MKSTIGLQREGQRSPLISTTTPSLMDMKGSLGASPSAAWAGYAGVGKAFPKVATAPRDLYRRATTPLERKIRQVGTGTPLTSSILPVTTSSVSPIGGSQESCAVPGRRGGKASARNGSSKKLLKASGWPLQTTIFTRAAGRYPSPPTRVPAAISATKSIWFGEYEFQQRTELWCWLRPSICRQFLKTTTPGHD